MTAMTDDNVESVKQPVVNDRLIPLSELAEEIGKSINSSKIILSVHLDIRR